MPNYCDNEVMISAITPEAKQFLPTLIQAFNEDRWCELVLPCPPQLDTDDAHAYGGEEAESRDAIRALNKAKYGYDNGYQWRWSNWGTKWEPWDQDIKILADYAFRACFTSAWTPPIGVYRRLYEMGFNIKAKYREDGMGLSDSCQGIQGQGWVD